MTRALRVLLLASLSFNVMFVVGYFCAPSAGKAPESSEQAAAAVARRLGLDDQQREVFRSLRDEARKQAEELGQAADVLQDQLCSEAASPKADTAAVAELENDLACVQEVHQQSQLDHFRRFMKVLTPRQRETAARMLHAKAGDRKLRKPHVLQEFDTDKDGKLSAGERAKAMQALRERHAGGHEAKAKHRVPVNR